MIHGVDGIRRVQLVIKLTLSTIILEQGWLLPALSRAELGWETHQREIMWNVTNLYSEIAVKSKRM